MLCFGTLGCPSEVCLAPRRFAMLCFGALRCSPEPCQWPLMGSFCGSCGFFGCRCLPCGSLWVTFGSLWLPFGRSAAPCGPLWVTFGFLWVPFGRSLRPCGILLLLLDPLWKGFGPLWLSFVSLWIAFGRFLAPFGSPWLPLWADVFVVLLVVFLGSLCGLLCCSCGPFRVSFRCFWSLGLASWLSPALTNGSRVIVLFLRP